MKTQTQIKWENEVCKLLQPAVARQYRPHLGKLKLTRVPTLGLDELDEVVGDFDIFGLEWMKIRVIYSNRCFENKWIEELRQETGPNQDPFLFYRSKYAGWRVIMKMYSEVLTKRFYTLAHVDIEYFLPYFEFRLNNELQDRINILDMTEKYQGDRNYRIQCPIERRKRKRIRIDIDRKPVSDC